MAVFRAARRPKGVVVRWIMSQKEAQPRAQKRPDSVFHRIARQEIM